MAGVGLTHQQHLFIMTVQGLNLVELFKCRPVKESSQRIKRQDKEMCLIKIAF